jgi:hypothetical protein
MPEVSFPTLTLNDLKDPTLFRLNSIVRLLFEQVSTAQGGQGSFKFRDHMKAPALTADGTVAGGELKVNDTRIRSGEGDPENRIVGNVGDLWLRTDGSPGSTLYVKESSPNTPTGWSGK